MELDEDYDEGIDPEEYPPGFSRSTVFPGLVEPGNSRPLRGVSNVYNGEDMEDDGLVESIVSFDGVAGFLGGPELDSEDFVRSSEWRMVENLIMGDLGLDSLLEDMVTSDEEEDGDHQVVENDSVDVEKLGLEELGKEDSIRGGCCSICMSKVEEGEVINKLPCGHYFHKACILSWLRRKSNCPLCRFELRSCDQESYVSTC